MFRLKSFSDKNCLKILMIRSAISNSLFIRITLKKMIKKVFTIKINDYTQKPYKI